MISASAMPAARLPPTQREVVLAVALAVDGRRRTHHPTLIQPRHHLDEVPQRPAQPVQPPHHQAAPPAATAPAPQPAAAAGPTPSTSDRSTPASSRPPALHRRLHSQVRERLVSGRSAAQTWTGPETSGTGTDRERALPAIIHGRQSRDSCSCSASGQTDECFGDGRRSRTRMVWLAALPRGPDGALRWHGRRRSVCGGGALPLWAAVSTAASRTGRAGRSTPTSQFTPPPSERGAGPPRRNTGRYRRARWLV